MTKRSSSGVQKNIPLLSDSDFDHSHVPTLLGSGSYGLVQTVNYRGSICAAKYIHSALIEHAGHQERERVIENFMKECERCKNITHPNVVQFHGIYCPPDSCQVQRSIPAHIPVMIMELMERNLDSYIMENSPTDIALKVKCSILFDVATGLNYLHQMDCPMIHRDLTPTNILLKSDPSKGDKLWTAKIADLGVSKVIEADKKLKYSRIPGCCAFMPPEALTEDPYYTTSLDVFSFGGVMLFMGTHEWPLPTDDSNSLVSEVERRRGYLDRIVEEMTKLRPLIEGCLNNDPSKRPTMVDVLNKMTDFKKMDYYVDFETWIPANCKRAMRKSGSSKDDLALIKQPPKASSAPPSYHHTEDDWYVGCIALNEAEKMLKELQFDGIYLVREKKECKKTYEICVNYKKPHHIDISINHYFSITEEKKFTTINELISYYEEHSLVHSFPHIGTKLMCPYNVVLGSSPSRKVKSPWSIPQRLPRHVAAADSAEKVDNHATPRIQENEKKLRQNLNKAKKEHGTIPVRFLKLFFTGSGAAGKTSFINLLLNRKFSKDHHSTNVVHTSHAVSVKKAVLHESTSEVTWTELDSKLEISYLRSILLPKPSIALPATQSQHSQFPTEKVAPPSTKAAIKQYKPPPKPQQSAIKQFFTGFMISSVKDSNLASFGSIIDVAITESDIVSQPGEVLNIITLLDTGGQPEYIHLLPTINIYPTVTFVIHDLSKSLSDQVLVEYSQHGKHVFTPYHLSYSNLDMIKLLMSVANDSVEQPTTYIPQLVTTPATNKNSYICLVGTHADQVALEIEFEVEKELEILVNKANCETAVWENNNGKVLFSVDNTTASSDNEDPVANVIRNRIEMLAKEKEIYELPITWMLLELEIRHVCTKREKAYISFQDCVSLAKETGLMSKEKEVKSVLLYHHLLGVLIYFEEVPGLCDYVIVDHQWWFDKLSNIICTTFHQASFDHHAVKKLKYQGLLSKELLQHIEWKDDIKEEFFLSLLVRMRIIAPTFTKQKEIEDYFIPFILPTCDSKQKELLHQYGHLHGEPLLVRFQSGLLPRGMFCSLIVELLQHSPKGWHPHFSHEGVHHTFSNLITFRLHDGYSLSLLDKVSYLEVQVRHPEADINVPVHNGVYNYLVYALTEVCIHLNFDYERLQYGFVCQCGKGIDNHIAVVLDITSSMRYAECSLDSLHLVKLDCSHLFWFSSAQTSSSNKDDVEPSNLSGDWVIEEDNPDQPPLIRPAMRLLHEVVVPRIAADWSIVADYLEYEVEYKRIIKEKCRDDPVRCCVELLEDWLSSDRGVSPKSWYTLIKALRGIKSLTATTEKIVQDLAKAGVVITN